MEQTTNVAPASPGRIEIADFLENEPPEVV
jgi:hypothetical protein